MIIINRYFKINTTNTTYIHGKIILEWCCPTEFSVMIVHSIASSIWTTKINSQVYKTRQ